MWGFIHLAANAGIIPGCPHMPILSSIFLESAMESVLLTSAPIVRFAPGFMAAKQRLRFAVLHDLPAHSAACVPATSNRGIWRWLSTRASSAFPRPTCVWGGRSAQCAWP